MSARGSVNLRLAGRIDYPHRIAAGFSSARRTRSPRFSAIGEHVIERSEAVEALVETRLAALDGLFDHRTPDRFAAAAFLGQGFQGFDDQVECSD